MIECWKMWLGHLAVCGFLLLQSLSLAQNHTCHRTKTVEVRVAVPLQEPATFRSYTWCLKVPPRCSKYTVVMRERITYETEVRNETVLECCPGSVWLYNLCVPACEACTNMHCDTTHNCSCAPGYIGPQCNQTCEVGWWGDRCAEACVCRVGEDCDPVSGSCSPSTSTLSPTTTSLPSPPSNTTAPLPSISSTTVTIPPSTSPPSSSSIQVTTTPNTFVNLTLREPATSAEDLTDFNVILKPRTNDSVRLVATNEDVNSLNALGDLDYPVLPTEVVESYNYEREQTKNMEVNSLSVNDSGSIVNDRWIGELGAHSGVTMGSALGLLALLVVTVSAVIRCRNHKAAEHQVAPADKDALHLVARNSHYAVPGPPPFSFMNGYNMDSVTGEESEDNYDHPRSARCLVINEPIYDELRY
uniref:EGF-like domain-containing protein n=1 Tax=Cuerna arida TaxID=1464854 RepID=A0A1B6GVT5_9HEMI